MISSNGGLFFLWLLVLTSKSLCNGATKRSVDPRWNTGALLPCQKPARNDWHALHRDDPIPKPIWQTDGDVKLIIHGYTVKHFQTAFEKLDEQNIWELGKAYANANSSFNVFIVEWTALSTEPLNRYYEASEATRYVGEDVAHFLVRLSNESLITDWGRVHIVGFSLGGHTVGVVGKRVQELVGIKIGRITGLDPAGPNFEDEGKLPNDLYRVLDKSDGQFVDIIHCNMRVSGKSMLGYLGSCVSAGHADFFHGGQRQNNCTRSGDMSFEPCSHYKCTQYMKESILQPLLACPCQDWTTFKEGKCQCTLETGGKLMGDPCPSDASGNYFVETKK